MTPGCLPLESETAPKGNRDRNPRVGLLWYCIGAFTHRETLGQIHNARRLEQSGGHAAPPSTFEGQQRGSRGVGRRRSRSIYVDKGKAKGMQREGKGKAKGKAKGKQREGKRKAKGRQRESKGKAKERQKGRQREAKGRQREGKRKAKGRQKGRQREGKREGKGKAKGRQRESNKKAKG